MTKERERVARRKVLGLLGASAAPGFAMAGKSIGQSIGKSDTSYSQAVLVDAPRRIVFVSGQVPVDANGDVPSSFAPQCRLVWQNIGAQLAAAEMTFDHLVKVTTYLANRRYRARNTEIRHEMLAGRTPAITVIIAALLYEEWLLEIDAIACV
jgi:2-iminobutanoate/2-iminopropanoate deaminase